MLIGIDGTGSELMSDVNIMVDDPPEYQRTMKNSFVHQLLRDYKGRGSMYFRGPTLSGSECPRIAALCMIAARVALQADDVVHLTGYSRGGAIAIAVAKQIGTEFPNARIPVMALFDAVDRERWFGDLQTIPGTVDCVFHALRDPIAKSRSYFGNCGTNAEAPCELKKQTFVTTHGGMGGVPLGNAAPIEEKLRIEIGPAMEKQQSQLVHSWMWANLRKMGIVGSAPVVPSPTAGSVALQRTTHTVRLGDTLSKLALHYYHNPQLWPKIYAANKVVIGPNPDMVRPGQVLVIP